VLQGQYQIRCEMMEQCSQKRRAARAEIKSSESPRGARTQVSKSHAKTVLFLLYVERGVLFGT
jgi:hypothetical protein